MILITHHETNLRAIIEGQVQDDSKNTHITDTDTEEGEVASFKQVLL